MGASVWNWIVSNSVLQGLAILFSIVLGGVWAIQKIWHGFQFMQKYKAETFDVKLRIAGISTLRKYYVAASDIHVFINLLARFTLMIVVSLTVIILVVVAIYGNDPGDWVIGPRTLDEKDVARTTRMLLGLNGVLCIILFLQTIFRLEKLLKTVAKLRGRWRRRQLGLPRSDT